MTTDLHDDELLDRVRALDPAARDHAAPPPARAAIAAARRRRAGRRATGGALATVAAALAITLAPLGGGGATAPGPSLLAQAAEAARPAPGTIVVTTTDVRVRSNEGGLDQRRVTWVRVGAGGRAVAARVRNTSVGAVTSDSASSGDGRDAVFRELDLKTGAVTATRGTTIVPGLLFQAQTLLERAQRDGAVTETTLDGRPAYRVSVLGVEEEPLPGDRDELLLDAETLAPLELRKHSEGRDVHGDPFTYDYSERVVAQATLPDTPANRALLTPRS